MRLGENIRKIRKSWGMNQDEFSEIFDATRAMISSYEISGIEPKISFLIKLYELTGIEMTALCLDDIEITDIPKTPLSKPPSRQERQLAKEEFQQNEKLVDRLEKLEQLSKELYNDYLKRKG